VEAAGVEYIDENGGGLHVRLHNTSAIKTIQIKGNSTLYYSGERKCISGHKSHVKKISEGNQADITPRRKNWVELMTRSDWLAARAPS
jgi:hypothetical protein